MNLYTPQPYSPQYMTRVADTYGSDGTTVLGQLPISQYLPPRDWRQLMETLKQDDLDGLGILECSIVLDNKKVWDEDHPTWALPTSNTLWRIGSSDNGIWRVLVRRTSWYISKIHPNFAPSIWESVQRYKMEHQHQRETIGLLSHLEQEKYTKIGLWMLSKRVMPYKEFERRYIQTQINNIHHCRIACVEMFGARAKQLSDTTEWLLSILNTLHGDTLVKCIETILVSVTIDEATQYHPLLVKWMTSQFEGRNPRVAQRQLSTQGQRLLRAWLGAANFLDFENLSRIMLRPHLAAVLKLRRKTDSKKRIDDNNRHKLENRTKFWKDYKQQFLQVRILVPQRTFDILNKEKHTLSFKAIECLTPDATPIKYQPELCIFEFEKVILVQEFRTSLSRLIVMENTDRNQKILFQTKKLSLMHIRALPYLFTHGHNTNWERSCQKRLAQYGILPDSGHQSKYSDQKPYSENQNHDADRRQKEREAKLWIQQNP